MKEVSAYKIWWAEFTPTTGRFVTKHDNKVISGRIINLGIYQKRILLHFPSKEKAIEFISTFSKKLDKRYAIRLFTDKQFSMANQENGYTIPYTKKQLNEIYYVG